jgi:hypothetical protein
VHRTPVKGKPIMTANIREVASVPFDRNRFVHYVLATKRPSRKDAQTKASVR